MAAGRRNLDHPTGAAVTSAPLQRLHIEIKGAVQGVGFRPFVYRLASEEGVAGWVINDVGGVIVEVEGAAARVESFKTRLEAEAPPLARIEDTTVEPQEPQGETGFTIRPSEGTGAKTAVMLPDVATCADCAAEVADPADRRHRYPFTNCTNCGPRFSIITDLPYDRPYTTMRRFVMCADCSGSTTIRPIGGSTPSPTPARSAGPG